MKQKIKTEKDPQYLTFTSLVANFRQQMKEMELQGGHVTNQNNRKIENNI